MKDKQLNQAFESYVDGVQAPPASVTEKAKIQIIKDRTRSRLIKRISVAAACVACACLITVGIVFSPIIGIAGNKANSSDGFGSNMAGNSSGSNSWGEHSPSSPDYDDPNGSGEGNGQGGNGQGDAAGEGNSFAPDKDTIFTYKAEELTQSYLDADGDLPAEMAFVKAATGAADFGVKGQIAAYYDGDYLCLTQAEVTHTAADSVSVALVYTEFTETNLVCDILADYFDGELIEYGGRKCLVGEITVNGEAVKTVYTRYGPVKYYLAVSGDDPYAYSHYLDLIFGK